MVNIAAVITATVLNAEAIRVIADRAAEATGEEIAVVVAEIGEDEVVTVVEIVETAAAVGRTRVREAKVRARIKANAGKLRASPDRLTL